MCLEQRLEDVLLGKVQLGIAFGNLFDQIRPEFLVFRPQNAHSFGQQVFLEAVGRDQEVDDSRLDEGFGQLARVRDFGAELQLEVGVHHDLALVEADLGAAGVHADRVGDDLQQHVDVVVEFLGGERRPC